MPAPKPPSAPPVSTAPVNPAPPATDALVTSLCRFITACDTPPTLAQLAAHCGLSEMQVHRRFKAVTGLTPRAWADLERAQRLRDTLANSPRVTDALYEAGFGSSSRLYERTDALLGMQPTQFRQGGTQVGMQVAVAQSRLGAVLVARSPQGLCAILMGDDAQALMHDLQQRFPRAELSPGDAAFDALVAQVVGFVQQPGMGLDLPLDLQGTVFQRRVWQALRDIPAGHTVTYAELAQRIGSPKAVRAVAGACAANPLAVAVPCHRVVRSDGGLSGYRWGVARKRALLLAEGARVPEDA